MSTVFSREHIIDQLVKASEDLREAPLTGELVQIREDYDRALDIGLELGYFACSRAVPLQGYESD